jgi:hypothetical protein
MLPNGLLFSEYHKIHVAGLTGTLHNLLPRRSCRRGADFLLRLAKQRERRQRQHLLKMHSFCWPGDRFLCLLSAGNLATAQGVVTRVQQDIDQDAETHLLNLTSMAEAADYVGL